MSRVQKNHCPFDFRCKIRLGIGFGLWLFDKNLVSRPRIYWTSNIPAWLNYITLTPGLLSLDLEFWGWSVLNLWSRAEDTFNPPPDPLLFQSITIAFSCSCMRAASDWALGDKLSKMRSLSRPAAHKGGRRAQRSGVSKLTDGISCQSSP